MPPERLDEAVLRADWGLEGDRHARPGSSRQVVLVQAEVLDELRLAPGATREQLTVRGLPDLVAGMVLDVGRGGARLELVRPRVPCKVMDGIRPGLERELRGRGGWCARVLTGGVARPGDAVAEGRPDADDPAWLDAYRAALAEWEASPPLEAGADGWTTFEERLAHLIAWDERGATRIAAMGSGSAAPQNRFTPDETDAFNAAAIERLVGHADLWLLHDQWSTAVVDAARRYPDHGEPWVKALTTHYREHS
jgi:MOSC domain-containing protein YiiM